MMAARSIADAYTDKSVMIVEECAVVVVMDGELAVRRRTAVVKLDRTWRIMLRDGKVVRWRYMCRSYYETDSLFRKPCYFDLRSHQVQGQAQSGWRTSDRVSHPYLPRSFAYCDGKTWWKYQAKTCEVSGAGLLYDRSRSVQHHFRGRYMGRHDCIRLWCREACRLRYR